MIQNINSNTRSSRFRVSIAIAALVNAQQIFNYHHLYDILDFSVAILVSYASLLTLYYNTLFKDIYSTIFSISSLSLVQDGSVLQLLVSE